MTKTRTIVALAILVAVVLSTTAATQAEKPKCKATSSGKKVAKCPSKPSNIVSGTYSGKDSFGELGIIVGTETSGPHAGQRYVQLTGGTPVGVTCDNGYQGTVNQEAVGYVKRKGRSFSGSGMPTSFAKFTISGTFTSPTTLKGTFESTQSPYGYSCSTGKQTFTAKWAP